MWPGGGGVVGAESATAAAAAAAAAAMMMDGCEELVSEELLMAPQVLQLTPQELLLSEPGQSAEAFASAAGSVSADLPVSVRECDHVWEAGSVVASSFALTSAA
eukprot:COSAG01_NODE_16217_length_1258_cov_2.061260_1_plen_104_part_00